MLRMFRKLYDSGDRRFLGYCTHFISMMSGRTGVSSQRFVSEIDESCFAKISAID